MHPRIRLLLLVQAVLLLSRAPKSFSNDEVTNVSFSVTPPFVPLPCSSISFFLYYNSNICFFFPPVLCASLLLFPFHHLDFSFFSSSFLFDSLYSHHPCALKPLTIWHFPCFLKALFLPRIYYPHIGRKLYQKQVFSEAFSQLYMQSN